MCVSGPWDSVWRRECAAHSCFSAHCRGRSGGWEDRLLTTSPFPPTSSSTLCHGGMARLGGKEWYPITASRPCGFELHSLTLPPLLQLTFLFQIQRASLSISAISFLSKWHRSLRSAEFVYFHEWVSHWWICSGGATEWLWNTVVREALGGEINTSGEFDEMGLLGVVGFIWRS